MEYMEEHSEFKIENILLMYWGILVGWQALRISPTGSTLDTILKIALIIILVCAYVFHSKGVTRNSFLALMLVLMVSLISFLQANESGLRSLIVYFFPALFAFLSYGLGGEYCISMQRFVSFLYKIIFGVYVMAMYAVIVTPNKFTGALSLSGAYSNELCSFFYNNHEYALYLTAGIFGCLICLKYDYQITKLKKYYLLLGISLFFANLVLTFSRSYILTASILLSVYILFGSRTSLKRLYFAAVVLLLGVIYSSSRMQNFVFAVVFKSNTMSGRDSLLQLALDTFRSGSIFQKMFGQGASATAAFFVEQTQHSSVHNGYMQILLYFGAVALFIMLTFLVSQLFASIKLLAVDKEIGIICVALNLAAFLPMITTTTSLFSSSVDSFFLTMFMIVVPKYIRNSLISDAYMAW